MSHKLIVIGELVGVVKNVDGVVIDKVNVKNTLTNKSKTILTKNLIENINTNTDSNKLVGLILVESKHEKSVEKTLNDLTSNGDYVKTILTSTTYTGSGSITYAARYSFTHNNSSPDDKNYKTFGLITGDDINNTNSQHLFSILNCNIDIPTGGSFTGDYIISIAIKRF